MKACPGLPIVRTNVGAVKVVAWAIRAAGPARNTSASSVPKPSTGLHGRRPITTAISALLPLSESRVLHDAIVVGVGNVDLIVRVHSDVLRRVEAAVEFRRHRSVGVDDHHLVV